MKKEVSSDLGTALVPKLLIRHAVPSSIGILVMSLNILIDTIFVGQWIGPDAIAAINVVLPVSFFIAALGMSIGVGGASIISRALGNNEKKKAIITFGNQLTMTLLMTVILVFFGLVFVDLIIPVFGGKGNLFLPAKIYYTIILYGVPVLAFCMMANNSIRAEGKPKIAMYAMLLPSISNLILDYVFIYVLDMGMYGAAWATTISYIVCALYILLFFVSGGSELKLKIIDLKLKKSIVQQISSLGIVTLVRQAMVSVTVLLLNNILFELGGESIVAVYAIISRMLMFATFPILGITQGFLPIAGFNFGAKKFERVKEVISVSFKYATILAVFISILIFCLANQIPKIFTSDDIINKEAPIALKIVFSLLPIVGIQLIGAAYFQAIGKALPALLLTLTRQAFFFIPLVFFFSYKMGVLGVWISFPVSEFLAMIVTVYYLNREMKKL
ncbi:MAG: MATE family efflux transporter [Flavobacteriaceae bacterium]|nr:MATE family efflux transporter [Flavobacteriaceae bacterium]|tara:strand:+ start:1259 stop:2593 length:1335 start_codon:yes stop_codon:yes gene_type:complete